MRAMVLEAVGEPLVERRRELPTPGSGEVRLAIEACAVCRTDLHLQDGDLEQVELPRVPGHQIVGRVDAVGDDVEALEPGRRAGVPWLGWTCGECRFCDSGRENLCRRAEFTGCQRDGGFAEAVVADARYCFELPDEGEAAGLAPLLCGGLIGYRALRMLDGAERVGLYGFGSAAHMMAQVLEHQGNEFYAFTRPGDEAGQEFARSLGASWAGGSDEEPPESLDGALLFAPVGDLVPAALAAVRPGGSVVCAGIHMSDIPSFPYRLLWEERVLRSVANLTRRDGGEFLPLAAEVPIRTRVTTYRLEEANRAMDDLRAGRIEGSAVLVT